MELLPQDLERNGFVLLDELGHKELIPFVKTYLNKKTMISQIYTICNILFAVFIIFWFWFHIERGDFEIGRGFTYLSYGFAIAFALIPIHEYIHVLAYKSQGAENTSYDANLRKFYFMAIADQFVANKKEFWIVALAPFVVISTSLILLLFIANPLWSVTILGVLLTHTAFSSGDFGIMSYFDFHKDKEIVTYDDKVQGISYFYGKPKQMTLK
ncbi:MAG TPA: DUF3267 domain-containing protein [Saprospiraceae bacterium]|nr:DUF3267 domain-containing protein [Saprospiraceae bacterium]HPN70240.1 DUF3267 domain-containing protein [Saprospiraceae bacterium]